MLYGYITLGEMRAELLNRLQDSGAVYTQAAEASWRDTFVALSHTVDYVAYGSSRYPVSLSKGLHATHSRAVQLDEFYGLLVAKLARFFVCEADAPVMLTPARPVESSLPSVNYVVPHGDVLQVGDGVVEFVAVDVIDDMPRRTGADERFGNNGMDRPAFPHTLTVGKKEVFVPAPIDAEFKLAEGIDATLRVGKIAGVVERAYLRKAKLAVQFFWGCHLLALHGLKVKRALTRPMSPLYREVA